MLHDKSYIRKSGILHRYKPHDAIEETLIEICYILGICFSLGFIALIAERREDTSASWLRPYSDYILSLMPLTDNHTIRYPETSTR